MISVAMTTYNGSKYVEKQLNSLIKQSMAIDEIIIVDDCSTDNTISIINRFIKDNNINKIFLYQNKKNIGYKKNFYKAISLSNGDYIFLCDQDDIWFTDKIKDYIHIIHNKNIKVLNSRVSLINNNDTEYRIEEKTNSSNCNIIHKKVKKYISKFNIYYLMHENISPGCTLCMTKDIKDVFLKCYDFSLPHDYFINIIAALADSLYYLNKSYIGYRIHENNTLGLDALNKDSSNQLTLKGNYEYRLIEAKRILNIVKELENKKMHTRKLAGVYRVIKLRYIMLKQLSFIFYVRLLMHGYKYIRLYSLKKIIGDGLYVLKVDTKFRKKNKELK